MQNKDIAMTNLLQLSGLLERDLVMILEAIHTFPEIEQVVLFGSRAKGTFKKGSDVDLAIKGQTLRYETALRLSGLLNEEKPLPYFFDVIDYHTISEPLLVEHIDRVGIVIFDRAKSFE